MKSVSVRVEGKGQFVRYVEHLAGAKTSKDRFRITISLGGSRDQSWGRIERWDGAEWREVASIGGPALATDPKAGYGPALGAGTFKADRDRLVALAEEII